MFRHRAANSTSWSSRRSTDSRRSIRSRHRSTTASTRGCGCTSMRPNAASIRPAWRSAGRVRVVDLPPAWRNVCTTRRTTRPKPARDRRRRTGRPVAVLPDARRSHGRRPSRSTSTKHPLWNNKSNRSGWSAYLGVAPGAPAVPAFAVPSRRTDLSGLAPAWIGTGDIELFYEENRAYAEALEAAGVEVRPRRRSGCATRVRITRWRHERRAGLSRSIVDLARDLPSSIG